MHFIFNVTKTDLRWARRPVTYGSSSTGFTEHSFDPTSVSKLYRQILINRLRFLFSPPSKLVWQFFKKTRIGYLYFKSQDIFPQVAGVNISESVYLLIAHDTVTLCREKSLCT